MLSFLVNLLLKDQSSGLNIRQLLLLTVGCIDLRILTRVGRVVNEFRIVCVEGGSFGLLASLPAHFHNRVLSLHQSVYVCVFLVVAVH